VDAGFVYISDVVATHGKLRAIRLPAALQPQVVYEAAVVRGSSRAAAARAFVRDLLGGRAAALLRRAGFAAP
jgi:ABC-type molybdate transport system substrate-binding protein